MRENSPETHWKPGAVLSGHLTKICNHNSLRVHIWLFCREINIFFLKKLTGEHSGFVKLGLEELLRLAD